MTEETFSDLGRVEAIAKLYEGTPYRPFEKTGFETGGKSIVTSQARTFLEGIDFDLTYFPMKHLGYKCITGVTGELYPYEGKVGYTCIQAMAPKSELADYPIALRAMSQGRGWFDYTVTGYDVVPKNVQDKIIASLN